MKSNATMRAVALSTASVMFVQAAIATPGALSAASGYDVFGGGATPPPPIKKGGPNTLLPLPAVLSMPFLPKAAGFVVAGMLVSPPLTPQPGTAYPWEPSFPVYSGSANLATGNLTLTHHVAGWGGIGPSVSFDLIYNSQSTASGTLGGKWSHSFDWKITTGSNPVVRYANGREVTFTRGGLGYTSPAYIRETLVNMGANGYQLQFKDGTEYNFDTTGKLSSIVDENSNTVSLTYTSGNLTGITDAVGRTMTLAYTSGKITSVTDSESRVWTLTYDGSGRLEKVNMPSLGGNTYFTKFSYNSNNCVSGITDRLNKTWTYAYGTNNSFTYCQNPLNGVRGFVSSEEIEWDYGFVSDQPVLGDLPDNNDATYPSDTVEIVFLMNEAGNAVEFGMDAYGRTTASRDSYGYQTNYTYTTSYDRSAIVEKGQIPTRFTYDSKGNVLTVKDPLNNVQTYTYDSHNHMLTSKDPLNHTTTNTYDSNGNLLTTTDPTGVTTTYTYNSNGTVDTIEDDSGNATEFGYDTNGNTTSITDPLNHTTTYVYSCCRMTSRTDARNRTTTYSYDAWGRRTGINYPTSTDQSFQYDVEGRMTQAIDGTGTRTYTYDALGRKTYQTDPRGNTTATYDAASRLLSQTDVTNRLIEYDYDPNGRMELVEDPTSWATYEYDPRGRMTKETFSNGVYSQYGYDNASRLTSLNHKKSSDHSLILGYAATYDAASRLTQAVESPTTATTTYAYDDANRLTSEDRTGANAYLSDYTYNNRGLRATAFRSEGGVTSHDGTYSYDTASRLTQTVEEASGSPVSEYYTCYDDNRLKTYPGPSYSRLLDYDEEGRLTSIKQDYGSSQTLTFEYAYGYDGGLRWRKDYASNQWEWYPCGVACVAGELTHLQSSISNPNWSLKWSFLNSRGRPVTQTAITLLSITRGTDTVANDTGSIVLTGKFDQFGVERSVDFDQPHPAAQWLMRGRDDEGRSSLLRRINAQKCRVNVCKFLTFLIQHEFVCAVGVDSTCAGGFQPKSILWPWGSPADVENLPFKGADCGDQVSDGVTIDCYTVSTDCRVAERACACMSAIAQNPPNYNLLMNDCRHYKWHVQGCVESVLGSTRSGPFGIPWMW